MAYPGAALLDWAAEVLDAEVTVLRGLRHGGSPWLLRAGDRDVVMRVARADQAAETATEVAVMTYVARIGSVKLTPAPALPVRSRPIAVDDFAGMRREQGASELLRAAEAAVAATRPDDGLLGLVHGDLWHGNTLWEDGRLTAVLDWDRAGVGPALGCRRSARLSAGYGLVPGLDGRSGPPRSDPRGHARAPRRLPGRGAQPAGSSWLAKAATEVMRPGRTGPVRNAGKPHRPGRSAAL